MKFDIEAILEQAEEYDNIQNCAYDIRTLTDILMGSVVQRAFESSGISHVTLAKRYFRNMGHKSMRSVRRRFNEYLDRGEDVL